MSTTATASPSATSSPLKRLLNRHPLVAFFVLAYAITWGTTALFFVVIGGFGLQLPPSVSYVIGLLPGFGPAIAALMMVAVTAGKAGVGHLLRRLVQWRVGFRWYLLVLFGVPFVLLVGASIMRGVNPLPALSQQWPIIFTGYLPFVAIYLVTAGLAEEPGWRGFALPRMQLRYGSLLGTLLLGLLWSFWHVPNVFFDGWGIVTLGLFVFETVVDGFILTWVYNNTKGSLLLVMLLHATQNASSGLVTHLIPGFTANQYYLLDALSFGACVLLIILFTCGRYSYQPERTAQPAEAPLVVEGGHPGSS
jgi:membrane protease YdiL (CAAX protease family)